MKNEKFKECMTQEKQQVNIGDVVSSYISLGGDNKDLCDFHKEKCPDSL